MYFFCTNGLSEEHLSHPKNKNKNKNNDKRWYKSKNTRLSSGPEIVTVHP